MSLKIKAAEGIRHYGWASLLANLTKFVQMVVLANLLTPADVGVFGMAAVVIGLATLIADAGTANALIHRNRATSSELSSLQIFNIGAGILLAIVLWLCAPIIAALYREPAVTPLLRAYAWILPVSMLGLIFQALLEKHMEFVRLARLDVWSVLVGAGTAVFSALAGAGVYAFVWGAMANAAVRTLVVVHLGWPRWAPIASFNLSSLKPYFRFGLPHIGQRTVNYIYGNVDQLLIGVFLGAQALGFYSLAQQFILMLSSKVNQIFARVFFPVFSPIKEDTGRLRNGFLRLQEYTAVINLPLLVGMATVAPVAMPLLLGDSWNPAIVLVQILSVVAVTRAIAGTVGPLLLVKGRTMLGFRWSLLVVVLQTLAVATGVATGSVNVVALASAMLSCLLLPLNYFMLIRPLLGACLIGYLRAIGPAIGMALLMGLAVTVIGYLAGQESLAREPYAWVALAVEIIAGALVYIALLWLVMRGQLVELVQMVTGRVRT